VIAAVGGGALSLQALLSGTKSDQLGL